MITQLTATANQLASRGLPGLCRHPRLFPASVPTSQALCRGWCRPVVSHTHSPPSRRNSYETSSSAIRDVRLLVNVSGLFGRCGGFRARRRRWCSVCGGLHSQPSSCCSFIPLLRIHRHVGFSISQRPTMLCAARAPSQASTLSSQDPRPAGCCGAGNRWADFFFFFKLYNTQHK